MTTLRARLTLWLWIALILVGSGSAAFAYLYALRETQASLDYQMQQVARLVAARKVDPTVPTAGGPERIDRKADDDLLVTVRDEAGEVRFTTPSGVPPPMPAPGFSERRIGASLYRVYGLDTGVRTVAVAQAVHVRREAALEGALAALLPVVVLIPVLALVIGFVIRRALRPLEATMRTIAERSPFALEPLPLVAPPADLQPLIGAMNRLIARVRDSLEHERRFIGDAAHALRTPIAALQLQMDVLEGCPDPAEREARLAELRAGIRRIVRLTHHLLALAQDGREPRRPALATPVDVVLEEVAGLYGAMAASRGVRIELEPDAEGDAPGDLGQLLLVVGNLLENALWHTPRGGLVRLRSRRQDAQLVLEIVDEGPGLPDAELGRVFERFYRAPSAHDGGSGLGLATARAVAERLGGRVVLENRTDRSGLIARAELPARESAAAMAG